MFMALRILKYFYWGIKHSVMSPKGGCGQNMVIKLASLATNLSLL